MGEQYKELIQNIYKKVNNILYFNDSSDYIRTLYQILIDCGNTEDENMELDYIENTGDVDINKIDRHLKHKQKKKTKEEQAIEILEEMRESLLSEVDYRNINKAINILKGEK